MSPILAFARHHEHLRPTHEALGRRVLIQVTDLARRRIEEALDERGALHAYNHLDGLRSLARREIDSELLLLIDAVQQHGTVYVTFL
jgi:DNA-binding MarR family transcriptional regulator